MDQLTTVENLKEIKNSVISDGGRRKKKAAMAKLLENGAKCTWMPFDNKHGHFTPGVLNTKFLPLAGMKPSTPSDPSDEEPEEWARMVDLPGFDDNVSPSNTIKTLLRFLIGEVVIQLARSSDHVDKPYLMLRVNKLCTDVALMEYGVAIQASVGGVQLVDKLHRGIYLFRKNVAKLQTGSVRASVRSVGGPGFKSQSSPIFSLCRSLGQS